MKSFMSKEKSEEGAVQVFIHLRVVLGLIALVSELIVRKKNCIPPGHPPSLHADTFIITLCFFT